MKICRYLFINVFLYTILSCGGSGQVEICDNGIDDNQNGQFDCTDPECQSNPACQTTNEICNNNQDDDGDNFIDCADPECQSDPTCQLEICDNGVDDNQNGQLDCNDTDCQTNPICIEAGNCTDGIDNDLDGFIDCQDTDCAKDISCLIELCDNGIDDDLDKDIDCQDENCLLDPACLEAGNCTDGIDNDLDGFVDCEDVVDCTKNDSCLGLTCQNPIIADDPSIQFGDNTGAITSFLNSCQIPGGGVSLVFEVTPIQTGHLQLLLTSDVNLGLIAYEICGFIPSTLDCVDASSGIDFTETLVVPVTVGVPVSVVVSGFAPGFEGAFVLEIESISAPPEICDNDIDDDGNGLTDCADIGCNGDPVCDA